MNYFLKLLKVFSIRVLIFGSSFIVGLVISSRLIELTAEPKLYAVKAKIFARDKFTPKCPDYLKPNPLILMISIDKNSNLKLNKEEMGSLENASRLEKILSEIFAQRTRDDVHNDRDFQVEKSIIIRPDKSSKYGEVVKLIEILHKTGADPIILDPSEEYCYGGGSGPCGGEKRK